MKRGYTLTELLVSLAITAIICLLAFSAFVNLTPSGRAWYHNYRTVVIKADDSARYETRRNVEDTCRAMVASYKADVAQAQMYRDSGDKEWCQQATLRANRTATSYNEFVMKNSFVWEGNVPPDIKAELPLTR